MLGEVLYFDQERGIGFISGADGNRYHFDRSDLSNGSEVHKGERVEFLTSGNRGHNVVSLDARPGLVSEPASVTQATPMSGPPAPSRPEGRSTVPTDSLFGYFRSAVIRRYAHFRGRARRKEYWGFVLFFALTIALATVLGAVIDGAVGNLDREEPIFTSIFAVVSTSALLLPTLAVTVRRIHDIGLSGWFILLGLIPSIGNLIILVFALIPSQKHANKWGEVPDGAL